MNRLLSRLAMLCAVVLFTAAAVASSSPPVVLQQTLGAKLRAAYQASAVNNFAVNAPWFACVSGNNSIANVVCSAWTASTAYPTQAVVSNGGHLYVQVNGACTSASSGGPSTVTNSVVTDNTCGWLYMGEPRIAASDSAAPSVSTASGTSPFSGAVYWNLQGYPSLYTPLGVSLAGAYGSYYELLTSFNNKAGSATGYGAKLCANVTDSKFAVTVSSGSAQYAITINGRLLSPQAILYSTGNPADVVVDFSSTSGYQTRTVCILSGKSNPAYGGIFTTASGSLAPAPSPTVNAAAIYDSYDAGSSYGPYSAYGVFSQQLAAYMGWTVWSMGQGSTGPQNPGSTCSGACYNYIQRAQDSGNAATLAKMDVIVFNVSTNDVSCTGAVSSSCPVGSETTAIQTLLAQLRSVAPNALIVGVGPSPIDPSANYATMVSLDGAGSSAFASWNDPAGPGKKCYVPFAASVASVFPANYQSGAPAGLPSQPFLIDTGDLTHPVDLGTIAMAAWVQAQVAGKCLPSMP
jgi:hypothetical protein